MDALLPKSRASDLFPLSRDDGHYLEAIAYAVVYVAVPVIFLLMSAAPIGWIGWSIMAAGALVWAISNVAYACFAKGNWAHKAKVALLGNILALIPITPVFLGFDKILYNGEGLKAISDYMCKRSASKK